MARKRKEATPKQRAQHKPLSPPILTAEGWLRLQRHHQVSKSVKKGAK